MLGAGSAGLTPSQSAPPLPAGSRPLMPPCGRMDSSLETSGQWVCSPTGSWLFLLHGSLLPLLTGLDRWQLGWEVSKTRYRHELVLLPNRHCSFKMERVLSSPSRLSWSAPRGHECAGGQPLLTGFW